MAKMAEESYDLVIIGAGMCGSAAARHAISIKPDLKILLVGPLEGSFETSRAAKDINEEGSSGVNPPFSPAHHSCHEDEGRITRKLDKNAIWASLASRSMDRYSELEQESNIRFHYPVGFMVVDPDNKNNKTIDVMTKVAQEVGIKTDIVNNEEISELFPFLQFNNLFDMASHSNNSAPTSSVLGILEHSSEAGGGTGAGYISARKLVQAQQKVFQMRGGKYLNDAVEKVTPLFSIDNQEEEWFSVETFSGQLLRTKKVLVCTNNATNFRSLLPCQLDLCITTQTTARFVLKNDDAMAMKSMPAMVVKFPSKTTTVSPPTSQAFTGSNGGDDDMKENFQEKVDEKLDSCYILPPVYYPTDDAYAVKMGHGKVFETVLKTEEDFLEWHRKKNITCYPRENGHAAKHVANDTGASSIGNNVVDEGSEPVQVALVEALQKLLPHITPQQIIFNRCATSNTKHGYPYIDLLSPFPYDTEYKTGELEQLDETTTHVSRRTSKDSKERAVIGCCVGCNGYAAKSSDEIGRLAARMILSCGGDIVIRDGKEVDQDNDSDRFDWSDGLKPDSFRAVCIPPLPRPK